MKILFLDFDGVICHQKYQPTHITGVMTDLDPSCVVKIAQACHLTDAKVAIHSTWVHVDPPGFIIQKLKAAGFETEKYLHPDWPVTASHDKETAIRTWLFAHPEVTDYVVVDDDRINNMNQVRIHHGWYERGFKDSHIVEVVRHLCPQEPGVGYQIKCTSCGTLTYTDTGLCEKCESKAGRIERGEE